MKQKQAKKQTKAVRNKKNCKLFLKNKKEMKKQLKLKANQKETIHH